MIFQEESPTDVMLIAFKSVGLLSVYRKFYYVGIYSLNKSSAVISP